MNPLRTETTDLPPLFPLPFVVAVTGHRDPLSADVARIQEQARAVIELVLAALPNTSIHFLSPLADGADQLFAEQVLSIKRSRKVTSPAEANRIKLIVPLPMEVGDYCREQSTYVPVSALVAQKNEVVDNGFCLRFKALADLADSVLVIPGSDCGCGTAPRTTTNQFSELPSEPYARLARYLNTHAHLLVAIWDGHANLENRFSRKSGGTLDVVLTRLEGFDRIKDNRSARRFAAQEQDKVVHIFTSRASDQSVSSLSSRPPELAPLKLLDIPPVGKKLPVAFSHIEKPSQKWVGLRRPTFFECVRTPVRASEILKEYRVWKHLVKRVESSLGHPLPPPSLAVLHHIRMAGKEIDSFNSLHQKGMELAPGESTALYRSKVANSTRYFVQTLPHTDECLHSKQIDALSHLITAFSAADVLASEAKDRWRWRWLVIVIGAVIAGASSSFKALYPPMGTLIETCAIVIGAGLAVGTYLWVTLSSQRNAYLEYRALAEGLRFQMYWLAAGNKTLVTDHYVQKFRPDLGWVRKALDGLMATSSVPQSSAVDVGRAWIVEQLRYLTKSTENRQRRQQSARASNVGNNLLLLGLAFAVAAMSTSFAAKGATTLVTSVLIVGMKLFPALGAGWLSYNGKMAHGETLKQAEHMIAIYRRAHFELKQIRRSQQPDNVKDEQARDLLFALGKEALAENANWLANYHLRKVTWTGR